MSFSIQVNKYSVRADQAEPGGAKLRVDMRDHPRLAAHLIPTSLVGKSFSGALDLPDPDPMRRLLHRARTWEPPLITFGYGFTSYQLRFYWKPTGWRASLLYKDVTQLKLQLDRPLTGGSNSGLVFRRTPEADLFYQLRDWTVALIERLDELLTQRWLTTLPEAERLDQAARLLWQWRQPETRYPSPLARRRETLAEEVTRVARLAGLQANKVYDRYQLVTDLAELAR